MIELNAHLQQQFPRENAFDEIMNLKGTIHRQVKNRRTLEFTRGGKRYFAKIHHGVGWKEILKNLVFGRAPVLGAENEWRAIEKLTEIGVATMTLAGKGIRGSSPAHLESFVITEALENMISLEDLARDWNRMNFSRRVLLKRALIAKIAATARRVHGAGLNHRDFYLCHFLLQKRDWSTWKCGDPVVLHLIDLHRVQARERVPRRWLVKDLGGLLFSALDAGLTHRDLLRFVQHYRERPWRESLREEAHLWRAVQRNASKLYRSFYRKPLPLRLDMTAHPSRRSS